MKHSEYRDHIVGTASDLFYRNGYNATGINEIISESGIAKATLYNHFKSKEDICVAYLQHKHNAFMSEMKNYCEAKASQKERALALFDFLHEFFNWDGFNGCWCIRTVSEIPMENVKIREEIQKQKIEFIKMIELMLDDNSANIDNQKLARQIYLLYEGAVAESHLHRDIWPISEAKNICETII